jgi:hypothetical protein
MRKHTTVDYLPGRLVLNRDRDRLGIGDSGIGSTLVPYKRVPLDILAGNKRVNHGCAELKGVGGVWSGRPVDRSKNLIR